MNLLTFIYSHDDIFRSVKQESSFYAERQRDGEGNMLFTEFVFDEEYLIKFRELFFEAQSEIITICSAYMKHIPVEPDYFETQDFRKERNFEMQLLMPRNFMLAMYKPLDIKIKEYLAAYIMYRWLETKNTRDAAIYFDRATSKLSEIRSLLEKRTDFLRIRQSPV